MRSVFYFLLIILFASGCSGILPKPENISAHVLEMGMEYCSDKSSPAGPILVIQDMGGPAYLNSKKILFKKEHGSRGWYQTAQWLEPPPRRLTTLLIQAFRCSELFGGVLRRSNGAKGDLVLNTELVDLYYDTKQNPNKIVMVIEATLVSLAKRRLLGSKTFITEDDASVKSVNNSILSTEHSANTSIREIVKWAEDSVIKNFQSLNLPPSTL